MHYLLLLFQLGVMVIIARSYWPAIVAREFNGIVLGTLCAIVNLVGMLANVQALVKGL